MLNLRPGDRPLPNRNYRLIRALGSGGFGQVWLARQERLGKDVVLKFCLTSSEEELLGLKNEVRLYQAAFAGIRDLHPGIVRLEEEYLDFVPPCVQYEYVPGDSLRAVLSRNPGGLDPATASAAMLELTAALAFAHARGIIHRDLKPENILVTNDPPETIRLKVLDFGLGGRLRAQSAGLTIDSSSIGLDFLGAGTPHYMSPEQAVGLRGPQDDVWALGVIWWELLTGRNVVGQAGTPPILFLQLYSYDPAAVLQVVRTGLSEIGLEPSMADVIASCFASPEDRPGDAGVLNVAISRLLRGGDVSPPCSPETRAQELNRIWEPDYTPCDNVDDEEDNDEDVLRLCRAVECDPSDGNKVNDMMYCLEDEYYLEDTEYGRYQRRDWNKEAIPREHDYWRGRAQFHLDKYSDAVRSFKAAIASDPENAEYHFWAGRACLACGSHPEAFKRLLQSKNLSPNAACYFWLGMLTFELEDYSAACRSFEAGDERFCYCDGRFLFWMGRSYFAQGEYRKALGAFRDAVKKQFEYLEYGDNVEINEEAITHPWAAEYETWINRSLSAIKVGGS